MNIEYLYDQNYESNFLYMMDYLVYISIYLKDCVPSVVSQAFYSTYKGLIFCLVISIISLFLNFIKGYQNVKDVIICGVSTISGGYLLMTTFESGAWNIFLFVITSTSIICIIKPVPNLMGTLGMCAVYIVFNESYIDPKKWHALRGSFMILLMKVISVSIDIDKGELKNVSMVRLVGYLMTPCSILYGPWFNYSVYDRWINASKNTTRSLVLCVQNYCLGIFFLLYSTCISQLIFSAFPENKWIRAYQDAQSYRFSHYYISFLSMSHLNAMNIDHDIGSHGIHTSQKIVHPSSIELPRSLIDVVTLWNLPMHHWLKNYVFFPCRRFGRFIAIFLTFLASSLLHGFNFALTAILISLGVYSYFEYVLRSQLARSFNACIKARPCYGTCGHRFKKFHIVSLVINVTFTIFGMFFLAYIAAMFDDSVGYSEGYSMKHTIKSWRRLHFSGHILAIFTYFIYLIFKCFT